MEPRQNGMVLADEPLVVWRWSQMDGAESGGLWAAFDWLEEKPFGLVRVRAKTRWLCGGALGRLMACEQ